MSSSSYFDAIVLVKRADSNKFDEMRVTCRQDISNLLHNCKNIGKIRLRHNISVFHDNDLFFKTVQMSGHIQDENDDRCFWSGDAVFVMDDGVSTPVNFDKSYLSELEEWMK